MSVSLLHTLSTLEPQLTHLLHDTSFALGKGNVPSRLVGNIFDPDLAPARFTVLVDICETAGNVIMPRSLVASTIRCFYRLSAYYTQCRVKAEQRLTISIVIIVIIVQTCLGMEHVVHVDARWFMRAIRHARCGVGCKYLGFEGLIYRCTRERGIEYCMCISS